MPDMQGPESGLKQEHGVTASGPFPTLPQTLRAAFESWLNRPGETRLPVGSDAFWQSIADTVFEEFGTMVETQSISAENTQADNAPNNQTVSEESK